MSLQKNEDEDMKKVGIWERYEENDLSFSSVRQIRSIQNGFVCGRDKTCYTKQIDR